MTADTSKIVTAAIRETYAREGIVFVKNAFESKWTDLLLEGFESIQSLPDDAICQLPQKFMDQDPLLRKEVEAIRSSSADERRQYTEQSAGFLRYKYMYWWVPQFRQFIHESPAAQIVAETIGSQSLRYFVDAIFMKQAQCDTKTYWHADRPAWPVMGEHVPTMWMPLLPVDAELSSLEYIAGSHLDSGGPRPWPNTVNAKALGRPADRPEFFDWETRRGSKDVKFIAYDMEPGDVVILHPNIQHGGGANLHPTQPRIAYSTRWFGDDVRWDPRPECVNTPGVAMERMIKGEPITQNEALPLLYESNSRKLATADL